MSPQKPPRKGGFLIFAFLFSASYSPRLFSAPHNVDRILTKSSVGGQGGHALNNGLSDDEAIERILVMQRKVEGLGCVKVRNPGIGRKPCFAIKAGMHSGDLLAR
jgi:hypothetical protein